MTRTLHARIVSRFGSQAKLAKSLSFSQGFLSMVLNGYRQPMAENRIATALGMTRKAFRQAVGGR